MKIIKYIFSVILALVVLTTSNGFILEQYFCSGCKTEHSDVALFEFGEISHEHPGCGNCSDNHNMCSCHKEAEHVKNTKISYFALDELYFDYQDVDLIKTPFITTLINFWYLYESVLTEGITSVSDFHIIKKPPLIKLNAGSSDFGAVISVFRV